VILIDTDTLSLFQRGHEAVTERLAHFGTVERVATTVITQAEILRGRLDFLLKAADGEQLLKAQAWLDASLALLADFEIIRIDALVIAVFEQLRQTKRLRKIGRGDLLIASVALAHRATLVTRNLKHFRQIPNIQVTNWAD
jgi:tRNA(fMet)-specific endonuclease VapC